MKQHEILDIFNRLPPEEKVEILHHALEIKYDFRRPQECIILAMGYRPDLENRMEWIKN